MELLQAQPNIIQLKGFLITHAGGNPARPVSSQTVRDVLWGVAGFSKAQQGYGGKRVHGHFITEKPAVIGGRVAIDTGAYVSGVLTAAKLGPDGAVGFISYKRR